MIATNEHYHRIFKINRSPKKRVAIATPQYFICIYFLLPNFFRICSIVLSCADATANCAAALE